MEQELQSPRFMLIPMRVAIGLIEHPMIYGNQIEITYFTLCELGTDSNSEIKYVFIKQTTIHIVTCSRESVVCRNCNIT